MMKPIHKGLLLAASMLLPTAVFAGSNTLYGDFRYSLNNIDAGGGSTLSGENNASRVGLKGSTDIEEGISAFYHLQAGASIDTNGATFCCYIRNGFTWQDHRALSDINL